MAINAYSDIGLATAQSAANQANKDKKSLGQDEFLELMTTQLRNQDPMEPMDNGEFLAQIAQFGTVNGVNELLVSFQDLAANLQSSQALQASNLIGHQVLVEHDEGYLSATGMVQGAADLGSSADVAVNIYDLSGQVVNRIELGAQSPGLVPFIWDGTTFGGERAAAGRYRIEVEATRFGESESITPMVASTVTSLTLGGIGREMQVELENLGQIPFSQINQIL
ncbi:MAG: flagellar hook assembly protein FlgD [Gammaproteobacteria bacterium]|jgi:flagellar basal-body rod modification protein FlgD|nr:flagellar hook assembly protein FlgD [Gammaproteobacteria bacterium]